MSGEDRDEITNPEAGALLDEGDLAGAMRSIDGTLKRILSRMEDRFTRNRNIIIAIGIGALVAGGIAWSSARDADRANRALSEYKMATTEARIGSCEQQRTSARNTIAAVDDHDLTFANLLSPPAIRSSADQAAVHAGLAELHASSVRKFKLRDCTKAGIAAFLSGKGGYEPVAPVGGAPD